MIKIVKYRNSKIEDLIIVSHLILVNIYISLGSFDLVSFTLYYAMDEKIERTSKLIHLILTKIVVPVSLIPPFIGSMANYYIFNLGEESFVLPCPIWYGLELVFRRKNDDQNILAFF